MSRLILVTLLAALSGQGLAQVEVGNGGDSILCRPAPDNKFAGLYVLDYVATSDPAGDNADLDTEASDPARRIFHLLVRAAPLLAGSLQTFLNDHLLQVPGTPDLGRQHIWRAEDLGTVNITDEDIIERIPPNCRTTAGGLALRQTVVRELRPESILYRYAAAEVAELSRSPLQLSMLLIHEWLWSFADSARIVRDANRFLHSRVAGEMSPERLATALTGLGVRLERIPVEYSFYTATLGSAAAGTLKLDVASLPDAVVTVGYNEIAYIKVHNTTAATVLVFADRGELLQSLKPGQIGDLRGPAVLPAFYEFKRLVDGRILPAEAAVVFRRRHD